MGDIRLRIQKRVRQETLQEKLQSSPFLTDGELAVLLNVSVQTIRLDRLELGIPELRGRTKQMAQSAQEKLKAIASGEIVGELIDLELGIQGISVMLITPDMVFEKTKIARGH